MKIKIKRAPDDQDGHFTDCTVCGGKLAYFQETQERQCAMCHKAFPSRVACENGHYICDSCHSGGTGVLLRLLLERSEKDPVALFHQVLRQVPTHMHGPEHHGLVPAVLLTAFKNCGGKVDLPAALQEALRRSRAVPGGACGDWGACGAAIGAGIFASIVTGSTPLNKKVWAVPNLLTARCLVSISSLGGPRCCKRTSYTALKTAAEFCKQAFGFVMPLGDIICQHSAHNRECIKQACPYYRAPKE